MIRTGSTIRGHPPTSSVLEANLDVLRQSDPELAARLEATRRPTDVVVEPSKSGPPTMRVALGRREVGFASAYDPVVEAQRLIAAHVTEAFHAYFVLGFGLGYHVEALAKAAHAKSHIFVFEVRPGLLRAALEARDLTGVLASPRVHLLVALDAPGIATKLAPHVTPILVGSRFVAHMPSVETFAEDYACVRQAMTDFVTYAQTCLGTTVSISAQSRRNVMMNAAHYCFNAGINDLKGRYAGCPAVIVAAGPSLQKNIDVLAQVKGHGVLIAMSTSLKPLLARGIVPDYVCMIDFAWLSKKYFTGLDRYPPITMIAEPKADWQTLEAHIGPKLVLKDDYIDLVLDEAGPKKDGLRAGATVAHLAFYFAEYIGADPICFVGQDLSFPDGITYTPGTASHDLWQLECNRFQTLEMKEWERIVRARGRLHRVKDVAGCEVYTDRQMFAYLQQFERDFSQSAATIIDATEGGARKAGTQVMTLAEAIDMHFTAEVPGGPPPQAGKLPPADRNVVLAKLEKRLHKAEEIRGFYSESLDVLEEIRTHLDDRSRAAAFQKRVDELRREVEKRRTTNMLVSKIVQEEEYLKLQRDREIAGGALSDRERERQQLARDIAYVEGLARGSEKLIELLNAAHRRVSDYGAPASAPGGDG